MGIDFQTFLSNLNANAGQTLISVATLIVLARFLFELCKGGFGGDNTGYALALRDFVLLIVLINSFDMVYKYVNELPDLFKGLAVNRESDFEQSVKDLFKKNETKLFLWFKVDGQVLVSLRSYLLSFCKGLYNVIILGTLSFYSVGVFARTMLGIKTFTNLLVGIVLFASCYPLIFSVVDTILLYAFEKSVVDKTVTKPAAVMTMAAITYTALPIFFLKFALAKGTALAGRVAAVMSSPTGLAASLGLAAKGGRAAMRAGTQVGQAANNASGNQSQSQRKANEEFVKAKKNQRQKEKDIRKDYKAAGVDPSGAIAREKENFAKQWGAKKREESSISSGIKGYGRGAAFVVRKTKSAVGGVKPKFHGSGNLNRSSSNGGGGARVGFQSTNISTKTEKSFENKKYKNPSLQSNKSFSSKATGRDYSPSTAKAAPGYKSKPSSPSPTKMSSRTKVNGKAESYLKHKSLRAEEIRLAQVNSERSPEQR